MTVTATARPADGALRHEIDVNGRRTITTDAPAKLGGSDTAPAPHELLPAMLASCLSRMSTGYARTRDWELQDLRVDVTCDPNSTPRKVELTVNLPDGLAPDQLKRLKRVADTCPVKRALETGFTYEQQIALDLPTTQPSN